MNVGRPGRREHMNGLHNVTSVRLEWTPPEMDLCTWERPPLARKTRDHGSRVASRTASACSGGELLYGGPEEQGVQDRRSQRDGGVFTWIRYDGPSDEKGG